MILLDTNVLFEAMRPEPNSAVRAWLRHQMRQIVPQDVVAHQMRRTVARRLKPV